MSHATHTQSSDGTLLFSLVLEAKVRAYNSQSNTSSALDGSTNEKGDFAANVLQAIRNPYSLVHRG